MLDDLADVRSGSKSPDLAAATPQEPPVEAAPEPAVFPLPAKPRTGDVSLPQKRYSALPVRKVVSALIFFVSLAIVGSVTGWYFFAPQQTDTVPTENQFLVADIHDVIPASASLWFRYNISQQNQDGIRLLWEKQGRSPSVDSLLAGDPRFIFADNDVSYLAYVMLPNTPTPFTLLPKTPGTEALVKNRDQTTVMEKDGWYILTSQNIASYRAALAQGAGAPLPQTLDKNAPLIVSLSEDFSRSLLRNFIGDKATPSRLTLAMHLEANPVSSTLRLRGITSTTTSTSSVSSSSLLDHIPPQATFVTTGSNFHDAVEQWKTSSPILDPQTLTTPEIVTLLGQLSTPYALFSLKTADNRSDLGLIVQLPAASTLALKDPAVEHAVLALLPLYQELVTSATPIEFLDNTYNGIPLRYANFSNPLFALDYTVSNGYLVVSTSKDSMFATLDRLTTTNQTLATSPQWQQLFTEWGTRQPSSDTLLGEFNPSIFGSLLPVASSWQFGIDREGTSLTGLAVF